MANDEDIFSGIFPALLMPLNSDYSCNVDALVEHINDMLDNGCKGVVLFGTTGEAASFSVGERINVLKSVIEKGVPGEKILVGTGFSTIEDTVAMTKASIEHKCSAVLMHPPYYFKNVPDEGVIAYFKEVIERVGDLSLKIFLYHFPYFTGVPLTYNVIDTLHRMFPHNVIGIKDSEGVVDKTLKLMERFPDLKMHVGIDMYTAELVKAGAVGAITACANLCPRLMVSLYEHGKDETKPCRKEEIVKLCNLMLYNKKHHFISALKAVIQAQKGSIWALPKPPLYPLSDADIEELVSEYNSANISK